MLPGYSFLTLKTKAELFVHCPVNAQNIGRVKRAKTPRNKEKTQRTLENTLLAVQEIRKRLSHYLIRYHSRTIRTGVTKIND